MIVDRGKDSVPQVAKINTRVDEQTLTAAGHISLGEFAPAGDVETPGFILYTSGSTGEPKGAVHRQSDIFYTNKTFSRQVLHLRPGDRIFSSSRLPFAYGLGNSFSFPLLNGVTSILSLEKPTPEVISRIFIDHQPTIFFGVPVIYNLLLEYHRNVSPLECSTLRLCVSAGEALPAQLGEEWERTFGVPILDGIGSTEMLHMFMSNRAGAFRYGSSGKLLPGYNACLLDQNGEPTQPGEVGNLWIRGGSAASGYWRRTEATAQTFIDGWVRTGDLYRCDEDGYWDGLPCACAFVVRAKTETSDEELEASLRQLAKGELPRFKRPRNYLFVPELPYTATGKIQRFKLREGLRNVPSDPSSEH